MPISRFISWVLYTLQVMGQTFTGAPVIRALLAVVVATVVLIYIRKLESKAVQIVKEWREYIKSRQNLLCEGKADK
jgi:hypothetical protein